ncbi:type II toxin-antitoxin system Phd/YefM family antitoxin [Tsukamurella soli]|uniref:Antitoxin n=1 Tax=Tsukamurella soli TaxID=644556 RepID=A0ABP8J6P8_9ACTN
MKTISQRELRNDNAAIMQGVEDGETYTLTRRGVPVARLVPVTDDTDLRCARPARSRPVYSDLPRVSPTVSTAELVDDLRGDR